MLGVIHSVDSLAERHGGPSRSIVALAEAQARAGAGVRLLCIAPADDSALILPDPALVALVQVQAGGSLARLRAVRAALTAMANETPPALLHDHGLWLPANLASTGWAYRRGLPYVISPHGMLSPWALAWRPGRKRLARALYQQRLLDRAAGLVASAEAELADIRAVVPRVPIAIIPNGVDIPAIPPQRTADPNRRRLLFLSRLHPVKNLPALIDAWARIAADPAFAAWELKIAGPDEDGHRAVLQAALAALGPDARITLAPAVPDSAKAAEYAAAEAFILPSLSENFGIVVAEAMAHGLPVITTTGTPWAELPAAGAGWHCAPDAASLAATLADALGRPPAELAAMGARGRALAERRFGWPGIAEKSLEFYRWLVSGGPRPDHVDS